jgi:hypothetical protein
MASDDRYGRGHHRHPDQPALTSGDDDTADPSDAASPQAFVVATSPTALSSRIGETLTIKAVSYGAYSYGSYAAANSLPSVVALGANAVAEGSDFGIDAQNSTVYANAVAGGATESDADVAEAIGEATKLGLSVMLKPTIDFLPGASGQSNPMNGNYPAGTARTLYNPTSVASFFASYEQVIVEEAKVAQANGASIFCIGCELDQLTGPNYLSYWTSIISAVRIVYSGKLTYAALWNDDVSPWVGAGSNLPAGTGNLATQVSFWNQLDYVGIDEYAPISDLAAPTLNQLIAGWTATPTDKETLAVTGNQSLIAYDESVAAAAGKPLLFTEIGYGNASDAAIDPASPGYAQNGSADNATADPTLQADLYEAFFDAWAQDGNGALVGAYLWNWHPSPSGDPYDLQTSQSAQSAVTVGFAACYAAGTRIATPHGERQVESLRPGHLVLTLDGRARPVVWTGHRRIRFDARSAPWRCYPIRMRADAFASGQPRRDLVLSPDHAVFVDGVLIPARRLVNGATILVERVPAITYWHVELATHDVLLAEGLPAESYLDTGNRAAFANAPVAALRASFARDAAAAWAKDACAALVEDGPVLEAVRTRLALRAAAMGRALPPALDVTVAAAGSVDIAVPADISIVRLLSPVFRPPGDARRLGVLLGGIMLDGRSLPLADGRLADGFHAIETHGEAKVRWTDGAGLLVLGPAPGARALRVDILTAPAPLNPWSCRARRSA